MSKVNRDWLNSRRESVKDDRERYDILMLENRSRFKEGLEYSVPYCVASGLVHAKVAVFVNDDDNPVPTEPRQRTLKELQNEAQLYNLPTYDTHHRRERTPEELSGDIARAEELVEKFSELTVNNLSKLLGDRELAVSGKKSELIARLVTYEVRAARDDDEA